MWDPEHFPGADNVPWQLLIRARFQFEIDAIVASTLVRNVTQLVPDAVGREFAGAAVKAVAASREINGRKRAGRAGGAAFSVLGELDDWCGTKWPGWWPKPKGGDDPFPDPFVIGFADRAIAVVDALGGPLQESLAGPLQQLAAGNIG